MIRSSAAGRWTRGVTRGCLRSLQTTPRATILDRVIDRVNPGRFLVGVDAGPILSGLLVALPAVFTWTSHQPAAR